MIPSRSRRCRYLGLLLLVFYAPRPTLSLCPMPNVGSCTCNNEGALVSCNGAPIESVVNALRAAGGAHNVTRLSFIASPEDTLLVNAFSEFSSLESLTIQFSNLMQIEPGAFNSLSQLGALDLRENNLEWLSGDMFMGIGTMLQDLDLSRNRRLKYLREDLATLFSTVTDTVSLDDSILNCDCHLQWLAEFIDTRSQPQVTDATCIDTSGQSLSVTNSSVDFSDCQDLCILGIHNCHENATCLIGSMQQVFCTCLPGFTGNGISCEDVCANQNCHPNASCSAAGSQFNCTCDADFVGDGISCEYTCSLLNCDPNATCQLDSNSNQATCVCDSDFVGDGILCEHVCSFCDPNATCQLDSNSNQTTCVCDSGFVGDGISCEHVCSFCDPNATCQLDSNSNQTTCVCDSGFVGDGVSCEHICSFVNCDPNATCQLDSNSNQATCVCDSGYTGDGEICITLETCDMQCPSENTICITGSTAYCICNDEYVLQHDECIIDEGEILCVGESYAGYTWPYTVAGTTASLSCFDSEGIRASASRECGVDGTWGELVAPNCISENIRILQRQLMLLQADPSRDPGLIEFSEELLQAVVNITFSGDVPEIVTILEASIQLLAEGPSSGEVLPSYGNLVEVGSGLLEGNNTNLWLQLNESVVSSNVLDLFSAMDQLGETIFLQTDATIPPIRTDNIALVVIRPECTNGTADTDDGPITISSSLLLRSQSTSNSTLDLPPTLFSDALGTPDFDCQDVGIVAVVYDGAGPLLSLEETLPLASCSPTKAPLAHGKCTWYGSANSSCPSLQVNSVIISAIVVSSNQTVNTNMLSEPILITLQHEDTALQGPMCTFLDEQELQQGPNETWLTEGCSVLTYTETMTVCQCSHLTSFALLMSPTGSTPDNQPLLIASKAGLSLSIICLIITICLLFTLKLEGKFKLHYIHRQLALALCLAQVVFLVGVDRSSVHSPDGVCTAIAALLHYLLLCTFAWQLVEGVHLYLFIVKVFFNQRIMWTYYPLAWGVPLIIVAITLGARFCDYGSEHYCWITTGHGTNWAFHGPVIAVLVVNTIVLVIVTTVIVKATKKKEEEACVACTLLHASLVLVPILGITWVLGFLVVNDSLYSTVIEWLFFIFTTLQGVAIFLMHCIVNRDVRSSFLKAIGCREAAQKQTTVISHSRRLSRSSNSTSSLRMLFKSSSSLIKHSRKEHLRDVTNMQFSESSGSFPGTFAVARPNSGYNLKQLHDIEEVSENSDSIPSTPAVSVNNTPKLMPQPHHTVGTETQLTISTRSTSATHP